MVTTVCVVKIFKTLTKFGYFPSSSVFYSPLAVSLCVAVVFPPVRAVHPAPQETAARSSLYFPTVSLCKACLHIVSHTHNYDHGTDFTRILWVATAMKYFFAVPPQFT